MRLPEPPEGILDPQIPWSRIRPQSPLWNTLKARLTGRPTNGEHYSSYVNLTEADADRLIENLKKDPRGYPSLDQSSGTPIQWMERQQKYQEWLVEEYLEKPFQEQIDQKIEDRQAAQKIADRLNGKKVEKEVEQAVELTTDIIEDPWGEGTVPEKQPIVVPKTNLLPPAKEPEEEQKPETKKKKRSSLMKSMMKTFVRMESHLQKLIELSEVSDTNIAAVSDAFRIQSDTLTKGFQDTTVLITKVTQAVDLQTSAMARIATNKKQLDQKRLDTQESLNEEIGMEQQRLSSGTSRVKDNDRGPGSDGGGIGGSISKVLGGAVIGKFLAGRGLKLAQGAGGKIASKLTGKALEKTVGKEVAETVVKNAGREAAEAGIEKGAAKFLGKKIPLVGLGLGAFFALERAAKGDFLGAGLELASGAASTIPGLGTAGSVAIDTALIARDSGAVPFAEGGLTRRSTFSNKRPGVTDLSPDLFKKMYQYELDYESRNKTKFGKLYADGYQKYFDSPGLIGKLGNLLSNLVDFFKNIASKIANGLGRGARNLLETFNPRTGTTTNEFKDVLPEGNPQLTSRFGPRKVSWGSKNHQGIDIGVDAGSRVVALEDGVVKDIYESFGGHGQAVVIDHGDGTRNVYGHVDAKVKIGDQIKKGNVIATVKYWPGSGAQPSDNTHLHLERRTGASYKPIDPAQYLNERSEKLKANPTSGAPSPIFDWNNEPEKRARGGPVSAGTPYFVGENGPELFVPKQSGFVMNNQQTAGLFDFLPGTGRVMAPKGQQFSGQQTTVDKFLGITVPGSERYTTYGQSDIDRYNRVNPKRPLVPGEAMYRSPDGRSQYTAPTTRTQSSLETGAPLSPERRRERALRDSIDAAKGVQRIPGANNIGGGLLQNTINLGEQELKNQLEMERMMKQINGDRSSAKQIEKLIAMAPLEEQMATSVQIIRVNNTNTVPIPMPSDSSDEAQPVGNIFKDLHLASIS
jgi:murein DD-endopeptidase MepM/ murein hydrolase activator NlpD